MRHVLKGQPSFIPCLWIYQISQDAVNTIVNHKVAHLNHLYERGCWFM